MRVWRGKEEGELREVETDTKEGRVCRKDTDSMKSIKYI